MGKFIFVTRDSGIAKSDILASYFTTIQESIELKRLACIRKTHKQKHPLLSKVLNECYIRDLIYSVYFMNDRDPSMSGMFSIRLDSIDPTGNCLYSYL